MKYAKRRQRRSRNAAGQGFVEYAAVIAFVGILIAFTFGLPQSTLFNAVSAAYSAVTGTLTNLTNEIQQQP